MEETIVIGAGPAGLTAAYELQRLGRSCRVLEADRIVGGISRTVRYQGYRFDIGGHRFFTKVPEVQAVWEELLGDEFLERPRLSRIFYKGRFFDYPLKPLNALRGLGAVEAARVALSYLRARALPHRHERNFEEWVSNRFGHRLYEIFFKTYTEKVWGIPCDEISADWAAQRIKNLDLVKAVRNALLGSGGGEIISTLIERFHYPRLGPGQMWERCSERLEAGGTPVELGSRVVNVRHEDGRITAVRVRGDDARHSDYPCRQVISSMPLTELIRSLDPPPPDEILAAADRLSYRDFLIIVLIIERSEVFPDNWIYIHSPEVRMGRIQNFKNWSPEMVPDPAMTSLGLEYFVSVGDDLWTAQDEDLIDLGKREAALLDLVDSREVVDGTVVRMPKAYPVYDEDYRQSVDTLQRYLSGFTNLYSVGRNGQHRYNNQDHSMLSGIFAARNVAGAAHDIWAVNVESEYHEEAASDRRAAAGRLVPEPVTTGTLEDLLRDAFSRYDAVALGGAVGVVAGLALFLATAVLLIQGGDPIGPTLSLLGNYFFGYDVSWPGAFLGTLEAGGLGFVLGFVMAKSMNFMIGLFESSVRRRLELQEVMDPLEVHEA